MFKIDKSSTYHELVREDLNSGSQQIAKRSNTQNWTRKYIYEIRNVSSIQEEAQLK